MPQYTSPLDASPKSGGFVYSGMLQNAREYGTNEKFDREAHPEFKKPQTRKKFRSERILGILIFRSGQKLYQEISRNAPSSPTNDPERYFINPGKIVVFGRQDVQIHTASNHTVSLTSVCYLSAQRKSKIMTSLNGLFLTELVKRLHISCTVHRCCGQHSCNSSHFMKTQHLLALPLLAGDYTTLATLNTSRWIIANSHF